jgi:hypothetical protein
VEIAKFVPEVPPVKGSAIRQLQEFSPGDGFQQEQDVGERPRTVADKSKMILKTTRLPLR